MSHPFFSIVIPTRNRADLLYYSLKSAQSQEFDDFEILVSNNYSSDETEQVILNNLDSHTRFIFTNQPLAMPDHWEFALARAKGEYILFLCDDDALRSDLLGFLFNLIKKKKPECISWMNGVYYHPDWYEESRRNSLLLQTYSNSFIECDSVALLEDVFFNMKALPQSLIPLPKMLNSCCHRDVLNKIKSIAGRIFLPPSADYTVAAAILALIPKILFIESPLFLCGVSCKGIGATFHMKNKVTAAFYNEFGKESKVYSYAPLTIQTYGNNIAESILKVKAVMPGRIKQFDLNLINYFIECKKDIETIENYGNNVSAEIKEYYEVLEKQDKETRESVLAAIEADMQQRYESGKDNEPEMFQKNILNKLRNKLPLRLKNKLSKMKSGFLSKLRGNSYPPPGRIYGSEAGFSNIAECAVKLKEMFPLPAIDAQT